MASPLDLTKLNPVAPDDPNQPLVVPQPSNPVSVPLTPGVPHPPAVTTGPSMYNGLPADVTHILEKASPNKSLLQRAIPLDLPKYAFQLGAGAVESASLGLLDPGHNPETTGEALIRGLGSMYGAAFDPVGPAVAVAAKLKKSTTLVGALASVAASEISSKGDASAGQLILSGTFGALFGKFYGKHLADAPKTFSEAYTLPTSGRLARGIDRLTEKVGGRVPQMAEEDLALGQLPSSMEAEAVQRMGPRQMSQKEYEDGPLTDFVMRGVREDNAIRAASANKPLLLEGPKTPPPPDFYAGAAEQESEASRTLRAAQQSQTRGGSFSELGDYEPPVRAAPPNIDVIGPQGGYSPNAIVGENLFEDVGIRKKAGTTKLLKGEKAQDFVRKMKWHPDKDVRDTADAIDTFLKNSDDIPPEGLQMRAAAARGGIEPPDEPTRIRVNPWEDPYHIDRLPRSQVPTGITEFSAVRPAEYVFADVQRNSQGRIPAYKMFWDAATQRDIARRQIGKEGIELRDIVKGLSKEKDNALLQYMYSSDPNDRAVIATTYDLNRLDTSRVQKVFDRLEPMWNRSFPNMPFQKYMTEIVPALRRQSPAELEVLRSYGDEVDEVTKWAANHEVSFRENSITNFAAAHIRALSLKEHFDPSFNAMMKISLDKTYPQAFRNYVGDWARNARGTSTLFAQRFNPVYKKMWARLGVDATDKDVSDIVDNMISLTHAGLVGFRPAPLMHNMFNLLQTGNRIGPKYLYRGLKAAFTAEGANISRAAGMIDEAAQEVEALRELASPGRFTRAVRTVTKVGLLPYGKIDDINRSAIFLGMRERFLDAAAKVGPNREKLLSEAGLYRFHEAIRDHVLEPWAKGDIKAAADLAGVHAAQATQWVYRNEYKPAMMNGGLSRLFTQFGVWPLNYLEYTRQMYSLPMPKRERALWLRDFALGNGTILGAMAAAGSTVGLGYEAFANATKWTFAGPLAYAGGPAVDMLFALPKLSQDFQDQAIGKTVNDATLNRVKSNLANMIPGVGLQRDIARAKGPLEDTLRGVIPTMESSESNSVLPSQNSPEELFRIMTGIGVRE
jgi:hypothetical protein